MMRPIMKQKAILLLLTAMALLGQPKVRPLHTRDLTRLSQPQVVAQLLQSDVIFIPVGAVETNGIEPSGRDSVYAEAFAVAMAEATGGLYVPGLKWSYPGTTIPAAGTINMTPHSGAVFLEELAMSLLRQGFRRQVYVSYSHGPAPLTAGTVVREFFDKTRVPILYINMDTYLPRLKLQPAERDRVLYGAHQITGRLEDLALKGEYADLPDPKLPPNTGLATLGKLGFSGSLALGSWINDAMAHSGGATELPIDGTERAAWGQRGAAQIRSIVQRMSLPQAMVALREHDKYTQEVIVPRLKAYLP
jgi:creatinine amidohydrolase